MKRERGIVRFAECTLTAELPATHQRRWASTETEMKNGTKTKTKQKRTDAILTRRAGFGKSEVARSPHVGGRMSSRCGSRGVTSGPPAPQYMLTSLRTPNSPVR